MVIPLIVALSLPSLARFRDDWTVGKDALRYLFAGSEIVSGQSLHTPGGIISNGGHGPVFPTLIGSLILVFGRDVGALAWSVRLLALPNALLAYLLAKRVSGRPAGLIAAALLTLFCSINLTFNIDTVLLAFCLSALLALTGAIGRNSAALALLSGALLGVAILTKETAVVYAPLALLAVLLLGWAARGALWHYLGLALVCLPWWAWYFSATGGLYLLDRLPPSLRLLLLVATASLLAGGALAYTTGALGGYLAGERRRWTGWFVALAWTVPLTGLALYAGGPELAEVSSESLGLYLANLFAPEIAVVPVLILAFGYALWSASRRDAGWTLLALALLFQVPVCVLVAVEEWHPRQYLVLAALVLCALANLVVDAAGAAWRGTRVYAARLPGALVAGVLIVLLVVASVERVEAQLPQKASGGSSGRHEVSPQAIRMAHWMAEHVPEGQDVLILPAYSLNNYLMFQDGGRHDWAFLRMDQQPCKPRPNGAMRCNPNENDVSRIAHDAIWVHVGKQCNASSLSMSNLLGELRRTHSNYLLISGGYKFTGIMRLPSRLQESGAFKVVHSELDKGTSGRNESLVLLKSTERKPEAVPTLMQAKTVLRLRRCEQAEGPGYAGRIRSCFPNGIRLPIGAWILGGRT